MYKTIIKSKILSFGFFVAVLAIGVWLHGQVQAQTTPSISNFTATPISACAIELGWQSNPNQPSVSFWFSRSGSINTSQGFNLGNDPQNTSPKVCIDDALGASVNGTAATGLTNIQQCAPGSSNLSNYVGLDPNMQINYSIWPVDSSQPVSYQTGVKVSTSAKTPALPSINQNAPQGATFSTTGGSSVSISIPIDPEFGGRDLKTFGIMISKSGRNPWGLTRYSASSIFSGGSLIVPDGNVSFNDDSVYSINYYQTDLYCHPFSDDTISGNGVTVKDSSQVTIASGKATVIVPRTPTGLSATTTGTGLHPDQGQVAVKLTWSDASPSSYVDHFNLYRTTNTNGTQAFLATVPGSARNFTDNQANYGTSYTYSISACSVNGCSFAGQTSITTAYVIGNFRAVVQSVSGNTATVPVLWSSAGQFQAFNPQKSTDNGKTWQALTVQCPGAQSLNCYIDSPTIGQTVQYRITSYQLNPGDATPVIIVPRSSITLDLSKMSPVKGWAWAGSSTIPSSAANAVGWVKFSSDTVSPNLSGTSPVSYGVYLNPDTGGLMGYAWSGNSCASGDTRPSCGYGWLSFNEGDMDPTYPGFSLPTVNMSTGALSGYARFLTSDPSLGSADGYVNLSGVSLALASGTFSGATTPANVIGQISFCDPSHVSDPQNGLYCVTTSSTAPVASNTWPTNVTTTNVTASSFTVQWYNPQSYAKGDQVLYATSSNPSIWNTLNVLNSTATGTYVQPITNLNANTTYYVKVRGLLH
jgi:hypothetical protein